MAGEYLLLGDFENAGYENLISQEESGGRVSSILEMKVYWISAYGNSSLKLEMHIHYLNNPGILDSTLICVCMILKKTIQYVPDCEIVDILASCAQTINDVNNIHHSIIRQLLDSTIDFHLFRPVCQ